jgi:2-dehydropantoate 2-reductase
MNTVPTSSVTIIGAGGIGCAVGHGLASGGWDVLMIDTNAAKVEHGRCHGISIEDIGSQAARFMRFDDWTPNSSDLVLLCTKCFDNAAVLERLEDTAPVIPIQNGFDLELQSRCSHECIASFVSECDADRPHTRITRMGDLHIGSCDISTPPPDTIAQLASTLAKHAIFSTVTVQNIMPFKHSKLMYNAAIGPLAAVTGLDNGQLLTNRVARKLFFAFLRENFAILHKAQIPLATIGPFHPRVVNRILRTPMLGTVMAGPFSRSLKGTYCSMSGDIELGRTEVDNFNGHLLKIASDGPCPFNRSAVTIVNRMAATRAKPELRMLDEFLA